VSGATLGQGLGLSHDAADFLVMRDARSGLEYLRSQKELSEQGLYLELHAYTCRVFADLRNVHDTDGRWLRLAEWLGGGGVPSIDGALRELELQPLHAALRGGSAPDVLAAAAGLLELAVVPAVVAPDEEPEEAEEADTEWTLAQQVEVLVAANRSDLARGKWIYDWQVDRVWPDADLIALMLDRPRRPKSAAGEGRLAELLHDDRFQRAIGVNVHEGVTWFNRERFEASVKALDLPHAADLARAAQAAGYRLDKLEQALAEPPGWVSTRRASTRRASPPATSQGGAPKRPAPPRSAGRKSRNGA